MISLKDFMETIEYRVTDGSAYQWSCYGDNTYSIDHWNQEHDGISLSITFDTKTTVVYEATAYDYSANRAYRLTNPDYVQAHRAEAESRGVDHKQAWDDVEYIDLESDEDFLEKATAIFQGTEYDIRVSIPITLPDNEMFELMKMAHERDLTFNDFIEEVLRDAMDKLNVGN
jgi:hypothetical protein